MKAPDFEELRAICAEAEQLQATGPLTEAEFAPLWERGKVAVNGHTEFLESLTLYAPLESLKHYAPPGVDVG